MTDSAADQMRRLLGQQRDCLKSGRLDDLAGLAARLENLAAGLGDRPVGQNELAALRAQARENAALVRAALKGVEAARARLLAIRGAGAGLAVYTAAGEAVRHPVAPATVERRA
ncbi:MAG: hypothetical protein JSR87_00380 [Proteobacteria bacterium]|nr:hypothetical protein [Pseudomonadota bacterium]MBS0572879.1 hypothetical protein [Pseudomonadota bacterium]